MQTRDTTLDAVHHLACGMGVKVTAAWTGLTHDEVIAIKTSRAAEIAERRYDYRQQARMDEMWEARCAGDDE